MGMYGGGHGLLGLILFALIFLVPLWKIVTKAGYHGAWPLVALVPLLNIIALWAAELEIMLLHEKLDQLHEPQWQELL